MNRCRKDELLQWENNIPAETLKLKWTIWCGCHGEGNVHPKWTIASKIYLGKSTGYIWAMTSIRAKKAKCTRPEPFVIKLFVYCKV